MSALSSTSASALSSFLNTSSNTVSVNGLISGIDTAKVIQGLLAIEQQKIDRITQKQTVIQTQQAAFKSVEAKLLALQTQIGQMARPQNGVFDARTVQVSDADAVTAAASNSAIAGDYHIHVNNLALGDQIASQGFDNLSSTLTHGTFTLKVGDTTTNLMIDGTNDTLQGFATAINSSGAAVNAAVINDGSGDGQQGYRLLLTARATGIANRVTITNNLAGTAGSATRPIFNTGSISNAISAAANTGTAVVQSNVGTGYTGNANNSYQFTVVQGGTVGTDDGLQLSYTDATGAHTGTITLDHTDAGVLQSVAQGIGIQFVAGTLVVGDSFTVKAFVPTVQAATDASVTLGSGNGALTVTSSSNTIDSVIPGVSISLKDSAVGQNITLTVANDTDGITKAIQGFVSAYNDVISFIDQQTAYDSTSGQGGPLLGNTQVIAIEEQVRSVLQNVLPGANPLLNHLGALGITPGNNGQLNINTAKLSDILTGRKPGVTIADVRNLFALSGKSPNSGIQFVTAGNKTKASATPYSVQITQAAAQASLVAGNSLAANTIIDNTNNTLVVSVDGTTSGTLTLAAGTYSRSALAQAIQDAVNSNTDLAGRKVMVGLNADKLTVTSNTFGTASRVGVQSGSSLGVIGFTGGESAQGLNVAGSFLVNGVTTETAPGSGQFLIGNSGNINTAALQVRVTLTGAQVGTGTQADLTVTRGYASQLNNVLTNLFDLVNGRLKTLDDGYTTILQQLDADKLKATNFLNTRQQQLQAQFNAMEETLSQLQSASNLLAQQSASLNQKK